MPRHWFGNVKHARKQRINKIYLHATKLDPTILPTAKVGNGSSRTIANGSRELPIRSRCCRLFHEVGRSKTTHEHQSTKNLEVLLAEHNLQIWSS
jgi:hypothetical protein